MSKNHLAEGTVRTVAALHARVFVVCRAATNAGFFSPCSVSHVLRSNCSSLLVELDYPSTYLRSASFTRHLRRTAVRLPDFSGRLGDARDQCHYPTQPLDNVLQAAGARQPEDAASGTRLVRIGRSNAAHGNPQSSDRRHVDSAPIRNSAGQRHSARSRQEGQSDDICTGAMLGDFGRQRVRQCGAEVCVAHRIPFSTRQRQSQQAHHRVVTGAWPGSGNEGQACPNTIRCLVHAGATGIAAAVTKDAGDWSGATRHGAILATRRFGKTWARTASKIRVKNDARCDSGFASNRSQTDVVWQEAVDSPAHGVGDGKISQGCAGARRMVRILRSEQTELVKSAPVVGDRNRTECRRNPAVVCAPLGHRTVVSQPETLPGCEQYVATKTHRAGTMDADSLHGMDIGAITEFGGGRKFSHHRRFSVARQTSADRWISGAMAAHGIYRTCVSGWFLPEVCDIHLPGTARRPKVAGVTLLSAADRMRFNRFSLNCATMKNREEALKYLRDPKSEKGYIKFLR